MSDLIYLARAVVALEDLAGVVNAGSRTDPGYYRRMALALETLTTTSSAGSYLSRAATAFEVLAGATSVATATEAGYFLRSAIAAELASGTDTPANATPAGYLKKIALACENGFGPRIIFSGSIAEGATTGRAVGTATLANPPLDIGTLTWSELGTGTGAALFAIDSSTGAVTNSAALDYETATSYTYGIQVTDGVYTYTLMATISVTNVLEAASLSALALDDTDFPVSAAKTVNITGATSGSTITVATGSLPAGMTLNSAARTISGTPTTETSYSFTLRETLADSPNSPRDTALSITISAAPSYSVILVPLLGQSNVVGRNADDAADTDATDIFQYINDGGANNHTLTSDITLLRHPDNLLRVGPGINLLKKIKTANPSAYVIAVPCGIGSTAIVAGGWLSSATPAAGGANFEAAVTAVNNAATLAAAAYPGASITITTAFVQGEQDASNGVSYATYYSALADFVANWRTRTAAAGTHGKFVIGSIVPCGWSVAPFPYANPALVSAANVGINRAHVMASVNLSNVLYSAGPAYDPTGTDFLHYQPAAVARAQGDNLGNTLTDASGPTMTSANTKTNQSSSTLSHVLTASDTYYHATFHIIGGADAAQFEISDPYITPTLRWASNGTGPADGTYVVQVAARDGAGNYGATQTITTTVSAEVSPTTFFASSEKGQVWDLTDFANMSQTIDGATPVTAYGQYVGWLKDLSPNAAHFVAVANDTKRPTIEQDSDGKPYLNFAPPNSSTFHQLISPIPFISTTDARSTAVCGLYGAAPGYDGWIITADNPASNPPKFYPFMSKATTGNLTPAMTNDASGGGGTMPIVSGFFNSTKRMASFQYNGSNSFTRTRDDANRPAWQSVTQGTFSNALNVTRTRMCVLFQGRMYSGFTISRVLTDGELTAGENWAASRCLTSALP